jgi:hypothetical protein
VGWWKKPTIGGVASAGSVISSRFVESNHIGTCTCFGVQVISPTEIIAVTGGGAEAGTWNLYVTTPGGTSAGSAWDDFTYLAAPTVSKVSPKQGPIRWRRCHHSILASSPVGPLVFGPSNLSAAWHLGLERPFSIRGTTAAPLTRKLSWR